MDWVEKDDRKMLSDSWDEKRDDKGRRRNLFKNLSKIILSLARIPLPRIGSFTINDAGLIGLTNRPLTLRLQELENEGVPVNIAREDTYTSVEPYIQDLLSYHDSRLLHQPNAVSSAYDAKAQMAAIAAMRAVMPHFLERSLRNGPFVFSLTDLHQSNIFVDEQRNIKCLIDMEWACSLPAEMQQPPYWLVNCGVDEMEGELLHKYNEVREEFMEVFEKEERSFGKMDEGLLLTRTMRRSWESGSFFYLSAVESTTGLYNIFQQHIQSRYTKSALGRNDVDEALSFLWGQEARKVIADKVEDLEKYQIRLQKLFKTHAVNDITDKGSPQETTLIGA